MLPYWAFARGEVKLVALTSMLGAAQRSHASDFSDGVLLRNSGRKEEEEKYGRKASGLDVEASRGVARNKTRWLPASAFQSLLAAQIEDLAVGMFGVLLVRGVGG